jgi:uncharacterized membrane protein required for colicin V production
MGAAISSNTAKAVSKVANSVSSSTVTSNSQINSEVTRINIDGCSIGKDVNIRIMAQFTAKSKQIVAAMQNTHIQNKIAQQMQQQAQSTVGSLGIGVAESSNYVSTYASTSTDIANYVYTVSSQSSSNDTSIDCQNSVIGGDFNIDLSSTTSFWNDQGVKSKQITDIANTITQTVQQKAVSKVVGMAGVLIILAIIIGLIGYALSKPIGKGFKAAGPAFGFIGVFFVIALVVFMWVKATPPLFSKQQTCSVTGNLGGSKCAFNECKNAKQQTIQINKTPLKYMYNIIAKGTTKKGTNPDSYGMLDMIVFSSGNVTNFAFNQGYNALACKNWANDTQNGDTMNIGWNKDISWEMYGVPQLPNPFTIPSFKNKDGDVGYSLIPSSYINDGIDQITNDTDSNTPNIYGIKNFDPAYFISKKDFMESNDIDKLRVAVILNSDGWYDYFNMKNQYNYTGSSPEKETIKRALHARYVLTAANNFDNNMYIFNNDKSKPSHSQIPEEVTVNQKTYLSTDDEAIENCYHYIPTGAPSGNNYIYSISVDTGGVLEGKFGVCNTRQNKLNKFLTHTGNYLILIVFVALFIFIIIMTFIRRKKIE